MKPLSEFRCINPDCSKYGERGNISLRVNQTYGKSDPIRLLECKACGHRFSERSHTSLSGCHLPKVKIVSILYHLVEGYGQRRICRLLGVSRETVRRLKLIAGDHAKALYDELVQEIQINKAQEDDKLNSC